MSENANYDKPEGEDDPTPEELDSSAKQDGAAEEYDFSRYDRPQNPPRDNDQGKPGLLEDYDFSIYDAPWNPANHVVGASFDIADKEPGSLEGEEYDFSRYDRPQNPPRENDLGASGDDEYDVGPGGPSEDYDFSQPEPPQDAPTKDDQHMPPPQQ